MSQTENELEAPDPTLSLDANDSTYESGETPDTNPPSGPRTIQTLGKPGGTTATKTSAKTSTSSST